MIEFPKFAFGFKPEAFLMLEGLISNRIPITFDYQYISFEVKKIEPAN